MNKEEFNQLFGKSAFIEHLTSRQQEELFDIVKGLIGEQKVRDVIGEHKHCRHEYCNLSKSNMACREVIKQDLGI